MNSEKLKWMVLATGSAAVAGMAARSAIKAAWRAVRDDDPPLNPASPETDWAEAVAWTVTVGTGVGIARLLTRRAAATGWQRVAGRLPEAIESQ